MTVKRVTLVHLHCVKEMNFILSVIVAIDAFSSPEHNVLYCFGELL